MKKRRWKGATIDYTDLAGFDNDDTVAVCLTQREVAILKALLIPAYWATRWTGLTVDLDTLEAEISHIDSQLDGNDCEVGMLDFRDNPDDICEVQYSKDGGETWLTMFRKDVCRAPSNAGDVTNTNISRTEIENNNDTWNGDIINVAPQWEYVDENSDNALCWAITQYVDAICDIAKKEKQASNDSYRDIIKYIDDVTDVFSALAILAATVFGVPAVVVGAIALASGELALLFFDEILAVPTDTYDDPDDRAEVVCEMYNYLFGETVQFTDWQSSINLVTTELSGNALLIADIVDLWNGNVDVFINYMILIEEIHSISDQLPPCDCPEELIIEQLDGFGRDFTSSYSGGIGQVEAPVAICAGVYDEPNDRFVGVESSIDGVGCNVRVALPPMKLVTKISVTYVATRTQSTTAGDRWCTAWVGPPGVPSSVETAKAEFGSGLYTDQHAHGSADVPAGIKSTPSPHVYFHSSMDKRLEDGAECSIFYIKITMIDYVP
ncbi:hypothetical protein KAR91_68885 [Candidatus Pacearchaeota archaeon]|nr:hypothetical protein [Candidatus Pacearchaeota archaeon]